MQEITKRGFMQVGVVPSGINLDLIAQHNAKNLQMESKTKETKTKDIESTVSSPEKRVIIPPYVTEAGLPRRWDPSKSGRSLLKRKAEEEPKSASQPSAKVQATASSVLTKLADRSSSVPSDLMGRNDCDLMNPEFQKLIHTKNASSSSSSSSSSISSSSSSSFQPAVPYIADRMFVFPKGATLSEIRLDKSKFHGVSGLSMVIGNRNFSKGEYVIVAQSNDGEDGMHFGTVIEKVGDSQIKIFTQCDETLENIENCFKIRLPKNSLLAKNE